MLDLAQSSGLNAEVSAAKRDLATNERDGVGRVAVPFPAQGLDCASTVIIVFQLCSGPFAG